MIVNHLAPTNAFSTRLFQLIARIKDGQQRSSKLKIKNLQKSSTELLDLKDLKKESRNTSIFLPYQALSTVCMFPPRNFIKKDLKD